MISLGASMNTPTKVNGLYEAFKPAKHGHLSPLAGAVTNGQVAAVKLLLSYGADVNPHVNHSSSSPLHQACHANDIEMVRLLLSADANVNMQNCYKTTPLMYAVKYGSPALVALILSYYPHLEVRSFMEAHFCIVQL
jgi:ankyrin repeat protein